MVKKIFVVLIGFAFIASSTSCKKSCDNCLHGGFCAVGGGCACPDPYSGANCDTLCTVGLEGYMCQTPSKNKFFGTWHCTSKNSAGVAQTYNVTFSDDPTYAFFMNLNNFNNDGSIITCTMTGKYKFDINGPSTNGAIHVPVSGYCSFNGGTLTLYINENGVDYFGTASMH